MACHWLVVDPISRWNIWNRPSQGFAHSNTDKQKQMRQTTHRNKHGPHRDTIAISLRLTYFNEAWPRLPRSYMCQRGERHRGLTPPLNMPETLIRILSRLTRPIGGNWLVGSHLRQNRTRDFSNEAKQDPENTLWPHGHWMWSICVCCTACNTPQISRAHMGVFQVVKCAHDRHSGNNTQTLLWMDTVSHLRHVIMICVRHIWLLT